MSRICTVPRLLPLMLLPLLLLLLPLLLLPLLLQVLTAGRDDRDALADLLADDCMVYAPILGPLKKKEVTHASALVAFAGRGRSSCFSRTRSRLAVFARSALASFPRTTAVGYDG